MGLARFRRLKKSSQHWLRIDKLVQVHSAGAGALCTGSVFTVYVQFSYHLSVYCCHTFDPICGFVPEILLLLLFRV